MRLMTASYMVSLNSPYVTCQISYFGPPLLLKVGRMLLI